MPRIALAGGAYQARSVVSAAQRSLNLFAEPLPQSTGEPSQFAHYPTPGIVLLSTLPQACIRGIRQVATGGIYVVAGAGVYHVDPTTWAGTHLGDITAHITTPVSMADNGKTLIIVDGSANGWTVDLTTQEFDTIGRSITIPPAFTATGSEPILFGIARYTPFTSSVDGFIVTELSVTLAAGFTTPGGMKAAIYTSSTVTGLPDSVLVSADDLANPVSGVNRFKVSQAAPLEAGKTYWLGFVTDVSSGSWATESTGAGCWSFGPYAEFPQDTPVITRGTNALVISLHLEDDPGGLFTGADRVDYLDGYFILNKPNTPQFYISLNGSQSFDPLALDFANKSSYSDLLVTLAVAKAEIWLLGKQTTEVWFNAGAADFSFQRRDGVFVDHGCAAKYSVAVYDDAVFWLGCNRAGQGIVIQGQNYVAHRISTYAIEAHLTTLPRIDDAIGMVYSLGGHAFYVLTFPSADQTWVYDVTTQQWHEWLWIDDDGIEHRHRANCCAFVNGSVVAGDWQNGNMYRVDPHVYTDNGEPIKRQRSYPHIINEMDRVFYRQFIADIESGNPAGEPTIRTTTETIVTWPPNIAQMTGVSVGSMQGVFIDWPRGLVYMVGSTGYQKYTTALATQAPLVTSATSIPLLWGGDVDPLSGDLIVQTGSTNGIPVSKLDPNTFAVLGTFGAVTSSPSYPASVWASQSIVCVVCNGVSFGFLKYSVLFGTVAGFRVDTMQHSGFIADIVSGSIDNRGSMIAGKSGGSSASVFLSWDATTTPAPSVPLYRIDIAASATAYNPATWPTTNPGITWTTVGTVSVSAVDPAWTGFTVYSLGYDQADGNVLMLVGTATSTDGYRLLKLNATTAAVMWNIATATASLDLTGSRINGSLWFFQNVGGLAGPGSSYRINTLTGTMVTQAISGVFAGSGVNAQQVDSQTTEILFGGTFNAAPSTPPVPVAGTSTFSGWGLMGGQTTRTTDTTEHVNNDNLIWLDWSDDRGHSWGNPVSQPFGNRGEYLTNVQWQRLGMARDRIFRVSWSLPVATALLGAFIEADTSAKS